VAAVEERPPFFENHRFLALMNEKR